MKAKVIKRFKCKMDHQRYRPGDIYTGDPDRLEYLQDLGYLGDVIEEPPAEELPAEEAPEIVDVPAEEQPEPRHVGGGWYELPDGTRVKGKEEALKALGGE